MPRHGVFLTLIVALAGQTPCRVEAAPPELWNAGGYCAKLIPPRLTGPAANVVTGTFDGYLAAWCGRTLPRAEHPGGSDLHILVGNEENNPSIAELVRNGLDLERGSLGDEGFRLLTVENQAQRVVIVTGNTPLGLKHGCEELLFFHTSLSERSARIDWPLDVRMKPAFAYRGIYMLPCWSAQDSLDNWRSVLKFNSEISLNRVWFWLGGFPLLKAYGGEYKGTDLADVGNVRELIALCRGEGMKFYIGDGWFTWHHAKAVGASFDRGIQYYHDLLQLLPGTEGIYLEPVGEGSSPDESVWKPRIAAMDALTRSIWEDRPEFEFAIAIGKFNPPEYRRLVHQIDDKRIFWWWCWGDPLEQQALTEHPRVLRWHTSVYMSEFHGRPDAPGLKETALTGIATSYDPGQGYGNPWNGWAKLGYDKPRNFHPYTMPYFSHQYLFRERCWNPALSDQAFATRLSRRLFDADMPIESIHVYLRLASMCGQPKKADGAGVEAIAMFVDRHENKGTARNRDTLNRMREAINGVRAERVKPTGSRTSK